MRDLWYSSSFFKLIANSSIVLIRPFNPPRLIVEPVVEGAVPAIGKEVVEGKVESRGGAEPTTDWY